MTAFGSPPPPTPEAGGTSSFASAELTSALIESAPAQREHADEASLVAQARAGDQESFGTLVHFYQRQVYLLALRMLHDSEEATEATQEVFLAAWQGLAAFRGDARFSTWLYRITYNFCLKQAEHQRRAAWVKKELAEATARELRQAQAISAGHAHDAERQLRETVRSEIDSLPAKYRAVLVLRHLQDLSYEEMAGVMRVPVGTIKTQLFRARALLKERLQDLGRFRDEGVARAEGVRTGIETSLRGMLDHGMRIPESGVGKE